MAPSSPVLGEIQAFLCLPWRRGIGAQSSSSARTKEHHRAELELCAPPTVTDALPCTRFCVCRAGGAALGLRKQLFKVMQPPPPPSKAPPPKQSLYWQKALLWQSLGFLIIIVLT